MRKSTQILVPILVLCLLGGTMYLTIGMMSRLNPPPAVGNLCLDISVVAPGTLKSYLFALLMVAVAAVISAAWRHKNLKRIANKISQ